MDKLNEAAKGALYGSLLQVSTKVLCILYIISGESYENIQHKLHVIDAVLIASTSL